MKLPASGCRGPRGMATLLAVGLMSLIAAVVMGLVQAGDLFAARYAEHRQAGRHWALWTIAAARAAARVPAATLAANTPVDAADIETFSAGLPARARLQPAGLATESRLGDMDFAVIEVEDTVALPPATLRAAVSRFRPDPGVAAGAIVSGAIDVGLGAVARIAGSTVPGTPPCSTVVAGSGLADLCAAVTAVLPLQAGDFYAVSSLSVPVARQFLYRTPQPGRPGLNTMETALIIDGADIVNAGGVEAVSGTAASGTVAANATLGRGESTALDLTGTAANHVVGSLVVQARLTAGRIDLIRCDITLNANRSCVEATTLDSASLAVSAGIEVTGVEGPGAGDREDDGEVIAVTLRTGTLSYGDCEGCEAF
ncbi:MAG: hypothetical protein OXE86_09485 [Alphaproteobacteria bacterium]|nr:hypothetical protein [Alphaproteobacteria bacterium]